MRRLVEYAREQGRRPRVHGNGFLQLDLSDDGHSRLHIWHPDLPKQTVSTPIHDHIFDMVSTVLKGTLIQSEITFALDHKGEPTHEIYMARYEKRSESNLLPTGVLVRQSFYDAIPVCAVDSYTQPAFIFHESVPATDIVVTHMTKVTSHKGEPRVLVPIAVKPDNSFRRDDADEEFLWKIIEENV